MKIAPVWQQQEYGYRIVFLPARGLKRQTGTSDLSSCHNTAYI